MVVVNEMSYVVKTAKPLEDACSDFKAVIQEKGFRVLEDYNVQGMLAEKGFERGPMRIIEFCNARFAHSVTQVENLVSIFMPCRVSVYTEGDQTVLATVRPAVLAGLFQGVDFKGIPDEVDRIVLAAMDEAMLSRKA